MTTPARPHAAPPGADSRQARGPPQPLQPPVARGLPPRRHAAGADAAARALHAGIDARRRQPCDDRVRRGLSFLPLAICGFLRQRDDLRSPFSRRDPREVAPLHPSRAASPQCAGGRQIPRRGAVGLSDPGVHDCVDIRPRLPPTRFGGNPADCFRAPASRTSRAIS